MSSTNNVESFTPDQHRDRISLFPSPTDESRSLDPLRLNRLVFSLLVLCTLCISIGCGRTESHRMIADANLQQRIRDAYTTCPELDAQYKLEFAVRDSHGETHSETFFIRVATIGGGNYPSHPGGFASADGTKGGFYRSCYIEDATATSIAVRFRLASRRDGHSGLNLNELVWATVGRQTSVRLPQDCHATLDFVELE